MSLLDFVTVIGGAFSFLAILISSYIARNQSIQLKKLTKIGEDTQATTDKLGTESKIRTIVNSFFMRTEKEVGKTYQLFFPVFHTEKPLPVINEGDYYAIHVISHFLNEKNIEYYPLSEKTDINKMELGNKAIFICEPNGNRFLGKWLPIMTDVDAEIPNNLPCWFIIDPKDKTRKIKIKDFSYLLSSPADDQYILAKTKGTDYLHPTEKIIDYCIFGRITINNSQCFLISGIHQYGTWIGGKILSKVLTGDFDYLSVFLSNDDFIGIFYGHFYYSKFDVDEIGVEKGYIWKKVGEEWVQLTNIDKFPHQVKKNPFFP